MENPKILGLEKGEETMKERGGVKAVYIDVFKMSKP